jgi:sec-independent protein translocase protein TatC
VFGSGAAAFIVGAAVCYCTVLPLALRSSEQYGFSIGTVFPHNGSGAHFAFAARLMLGMGLAFAFVGCLPSLVRIGILDSRKIAGFRRYMIVINFALGAVLTTPEVMTQILMFVPLQLIYEVGIWVARYSEYRAKSHA